MMREAAVAGLSMASLHDPAKNAELMQYVEALKNDDDGWKKCIDNMITNNMSSGDEYFVMLQVVEDFLNSRYCMSDEGSTVAIRQLLSHCLLRVNAEEIPSYLLNKMAQIFALVFANDFPIRWPNFMQEVFLSSNLDNSRVALFYLKTLIAIDTEVVDRDIQRSFPELDRNTKIKDGMRDLCMKECAESWHRLLRSSPDVLVQSTCLSVIGLYIDWMDVELIANEQFIPIFLERLANKETSEAAQSAMTGVVNKKMAAESKLSLVNALLQVMHNNQLLRVEQDSDEEEEERVANMLSVLGTAILDNYTKDDGESEKALLMLTHYLPSLMQLLASENEEASVRVIPLIRAYAAFCIAHQPPEWMKVLSEVVGVCVKRYKMPEELDLDGTGEEEMAFKEYRNDIRTLIHSISLKYPAVLVDVLERSLEESVSSSSLHVKEAVAHLIYSLSELMPNGLLNARTEVMERACRLPLRLLSISSPNTSSPSLTLLFFETLSRYERLLTRDASNLQSLLSHFIGECGMAHPSPSVRSRVIYLFSRFVKSTRVQLQKFVPHVIERVAPLLQSCQDLTTSLLSYEDQAFLLEATATLIVYGELQLEEKARYMTELGERIAENFTRYTAPLEEAERAGDEKKKEKLNDAAAAAIHCAIKISKAFDVCGKEKSMKSCGCVHVFLQLLSVFMSALSVNRPLLTEYTRQYAGRLVLCMDTEVLPLASTLLFTLAHLSHNADSMQHLLILTQQIVQKHKERVLSSGLDMGKVVSTACRVCMEGSSSSGGGGEGVDGRRSDMYLKRALLTLLLALIKNGLFAHLEEKVVDETVACMCHLTRDQDSTTQKTSVTVLNSLPQPTPQHVHSILHTLLSLPLLPHLSFNDAAVTLLMHEVSLTLKNALQTHAEVMNGLLASLFPAQFAQQLHTALSSLQGKDLDRAVTVLYSQLRE